MIFSDHCSIQMLSENGVSIIDNAECLEFDIKDKPVFVSETGETVIEYSGLASDKNAERTWAIASYRANGYSPLHYHRERTEIYYIISGSAKVIIDGHENFLSLGENIQIFPGQTHQVHNASSEGELKLIVKCTPSWVVVDCCLI